MKTVAGLPATVFVLNYLCKNTSKMCKCGKVKLKHLDFLS